MMQQPLGEDGRYRTVRRIDAGGMGEIWEADDTLLGRRVAIKVLAEELADDPVALRRFRREARATAKLDHPNVIRVFDFVEGEVPFLVLELLEGQTLADRLRRDGALPTAEAARVAAAVADGLDVAHRAGIIHRDIKPSNIMLTASGDVKVMDFGIAAAWEAHSTTGQQLLATATYAPPERITGGRASPAGDLYSLGVVLYEMLTGRPASAGALAARLRAAVQAAQASAAAFSPGMVGVDRPAEPTRRLSADRTQVVTGPHTRRGRSRAVTGVTAVGLLGLAAAAALLWQTTNVDGPGRSPSPSAVTVRQRPAAQPASITVTLRYRARVWTRCTVDGRLAFDG